jgi:hypothetical protein
MKKNNIIILSLIVVLIGILSVTYFINQDDIEYKQQLNQDAIFEVLYQDEVVDSFTMVEIADMGEVTFTANLKSSGNDPVEHEYTGVLLKTIFEEAGLDPEEKTSVTVIAIDGYAAAITMDKFMDDDNVYLAYMRDGELLGTKADGGNGPYQLIISKAQFSQYWVKFVYQAELVD